MQAVDYCTVAEAHKEQIANLTKRKTLAWTGQRFFTRFAIRFRQRLPFQPPRFAHAADGDGLFLSDGGSGILNGLDVGGIALP